MLREAICLLLPCASASISAYNHDPGAVASHPNWMKQLSGTQRLSQLSLPGTHDTMGLFGGDAAATQSMTLVEQLHSGIRACDIRCQHVNDTCEIHHGFVDERADLDKVFHDLAAFLVNNPSEVVLMRIGASEMAPLDNSRDWEDTWRVYRARHDASYAQRTGKPLFWPPAQTSGAESCWSEPFPSLAISNPRLEDVRGMVVVIQDFVDRRGADDCYGLPFHRIVDLQDEWKLRSNWDLYDKWWAIKAHFEVSATGLQERYYANYLSGSVGAFPYFVASGQENPGNGSPLLSTGRMAAELGSLSEVWPDFPRACGPTSGCTVSFQGTNQLAADYVRSRGPRRAGAVMADFPGKGLIEAVIAQNAFKHLVDPVNASQAQLLL